MNKTKLLTIAVLGLLLLNLGTLGMMFMNKTQGPPRGGMLPPPGEGPKMIIIDRLHFDDAQRKQYEVLIDDHKSKTNALHDASKELHNQLYILLKEETTDKNKSDSLISQIAENQKQIEYLNIDHFRKIRMLCKPEQLNDFNNLAEDLPSLFGPKGPPRP